MSTDQYAGLAISGVSGKRFHRLPVGRGEKHVDRRRIGRPNPESGAGIIWKQIDAESGGAARGGLEGVHGVIFPLPLLTPPISSHPNSHNSSPPPPAPAEGPPSPSHRRWS